ncbi:MAG: ATP-binding cassette domain-containing protein [Treponema sp.]|jgi:lipopolysaccharide transport system ATP-binding protein|nr:ATP-binding cassette domain-containing protein [Treponema sp.]
MSDIAIRIEHLSKMYRLGVINNGTLWKDIQTWIALKRGKEDPHSKIGEDKYRGDDDHFWALKDISVDIKQGDRVGIIGKNGAGKSTLLKLLSRITAPTEGVIKIKGKIASLLEVGTGFHGELTGRENIYLNGAILGMKKRRITQKMDEIIAFSGIDQHIDTPVKRYSSGMFVRLAFAVAAHLDSDILIADEVLAVGDAEFQKKALGKMQDLSTGQGRTVLFVSHNMVAVKSLCNCGILLEKGKICYNDIIQNVIEFYSSDKTSKGIVNNYWNFTNSPGTDKIKVKSAYITFDGKSLTVETFFDIIVEFWCLEEGFPINVEMHLYDSREILIFGVSTECKPLKKGIHKAIFHIPGGFLNDNVYYVTIHFVYDRSTAYFYCEHANSFEILDNRTALGYLGKWGGLIRPSHITSDYSFVGNLSQLNTC